MIEQGVNEEFVSKNLMSVDASSKEWDQDIRSGKAEWSEENM